MIQAIIGALASITLAGLVGVVRYCYIQLLPTMGPRYVDRMLFALIHHDDNYYEIGFLASIRNNTGKGITVHGVKIYMTRFDLAGRGGIGIHNMSKFKRPPILEGPIYIPPWSSRWVQTVLPVYMEAMLIGDAPEFFLFGLWWCTASCGRIGPRLEKCGTLKRVIPVAEWTSLTDESGQLAIETEELQIAPKKFSLNAETQKVLLYNSDRKAEYQVYGFSTTPHARSESGTLVWVGGKGNPPLDGGWTILGHTYPEVWSNKDLALIYDSIVPPNSDGEPQPFATFSGWEKTLGVTKAVPTTVSREYLSFPIPFPEELPWHLRTLHRLGLRRLVM